jgi:hypothetical protein
MSFDRTKPTAGKLPSGSGERGSRSLRTRSDFLLVALCQSSVIFSPTSQPGSKWLPGGGSRNRDVSRKTTARWPAGYSRRIFSGRRFRLFWMKTSINRRSTMYIESLMRNRRLRLRSISAVCDVPEIVRLTSQNPQRGGRRAFACALRSKTRSNQTRGKCAS